MDKAISEHYRKIGKKGGKARAEKLGKEARQKIASSGGKALWKKIKEGLDK